MSLIKVPSGAGCGRCNFLAVAGDSQPVPYFDTSCFDKDRQY